MKSQAAKVSKTNTAPETAPANGSYLEALHLVERLHRRLLDVIKDEFERREREEQQHGQVGVGHRATVQSVACGSSPCSPRRPRSCSRSVRVTTWSG